MGEGQVHRGQHQQQQDGERGEGQKRSRSRPRDLIPTQLSSIFCPVGSLLPPVEQSHQVHIPAFHSTLLDSSSSVAERTIRSINRTWKTPFEILLPKYIC